jgi:hypothetical protein
LREPVTTLIGNKNTTLYPLGGAVIDVSCADLNLGAELPPSYSFCDNTDQDGIITNNKLFTLLNFVTSSGFLSIEDRDIFSDLLEDTRSLPPAPADPHYMPVFEKRPANDSRD